MKCSKNGKWALVFVGVILVISGAFFLSVWDSLLEKTLHHELILSKSSNSFKSWSDPPVPIYFSVYMFNWTNAEEVIESNWKIKPEFVECGPYVFSQHHRRANLVWNKNGTVTFQQQRYWIPIPSMSNGNFSDNITNINPVAAFVANSLKYLPKAVLQPAANLLLMQFNEKIFVTKTVKELLFDGYADKMLTYVSTIANFFGIRFNVYKMGWFNERNNSATYEGTFTMYTGKYNISLLGLVDKWNMLPKTNIYDGLCSIVNGSTGELYPPGSPQQIDIFLADFCSYVTLKHLGSETVNGVVGNRFVGSDYTFDNGSKYPEQACFVYNPEIPSGVRDVSKCNLGAPAFMSFPHFYLADPSYIESIKGLRPNKTLHESNIVIEPNTGVTLKGQVRLQLNLFLDNIPGMSLFTDVKPVFMPILWFEQAATTPERYCLQIEMFLAAKYGGPYFMTFLTCVGVILIGIGLYLLHGTRRSVSLSTYNQFENEGKSS